MISIGLPARRHCAVVPTPPWCTTSAARGNSAEKGAYSATQIDSGSACRGRFRSSVPISSTARTPSRIAALALNS